MFIVEAVDQFTPLDLDRYGVVPWSLDHLIGIPLMPFLHGGFPHLISNALALLALGMFILQRGLFRQVTLWGGLIAGALVWALPIQGGLHIGASGIVFVYIGFLLVRGIKTRRLADFVVGALVGILYAGAIESLFGGIIPGISWEGHAYGFAAGLIIAWRLPRGRA